MTAYTINGTGEKDASLSATYSPAGVPSGAGDTVTFAANQRLRIPSGFTFDAVVVPAAGSGAGTRSGFIIEGGGARILRADETWAAFNYLEFVGSGVATLDLNGFNLWHNTTGTAVNSVITSDGVCRPVITSSAAMSTVSTPADAAAVGYLKLENAYVTNVSFKYGSGFYAGHDFIVKKTTFYNAGRWENYTYSQLSDDYVIDRVVWAGTCVNPLFETPRNKIINLRAQNGNTGGTLSTERRIRNLVILSTGVSSPLLRMDHCPSNITVDNVYLNTAQQITNNDVDWQNCFFYDANVESLGATREWKACFVASNRNNPHTVEGGARWTDSIIESVYGASGLQTDGADHFMSTSLTANKYVKGGLVIDSYGGALLNTVGTVAGATGTWLLEHCTYVIDCRDAVYGQLIRNENSGFFAAGASVTVQSNILHARSNPSGAASIRACNMESGAATGQIDVLRNNCLSIPHADLNQVYYRCDQGTDDVFVDPMFTDESRGIVSWGAQYGYTGYADTCDGLIYGAVGYDPSSPSSPLDDSLITGRTVVDLIGWISAGYVPQNVAVSTAAHDGTTIGAFAYQAPPPSGDGNGLTSVGLTSRGLTSPSLTSVGL
jgi:hypothetical protein